MSYLGTPTIFKFYWPEDEPAVQSYLDYVLNPNADRFSVATALAGMRVGATLVHDDVWSWEALPIRPETYGNVAWTSGEVSVVKPLFKPAPMLAFAAAPVTSFGPSGDLRIYAGFGRSTVGRPANAPPIADCSSPIDLAWGGMQGPLTRRSPVVLNFPIACRFSGAIEIRSSGAPGIVAMLVRGRRSLPVPLQPVSSSDGSTTWQGTIDLAERDTIVVKPASTPVDVFGIEIRSDGVPTTPDRPAALSMRWWNVVSAPLTYSSGERELVLNQSYAPAWAAFDVCNGNYRPLPHEHANGYANGFRLGGCGRVMLVNWAQVALVLGSAVGALAFAVTILLWALARSESLRNTSRSTVRKTGDASALS